jgi:hypothetical protein
MLTLSYFLVTNPKQKNPITLKPNHLLALCITLLMLNSIQSLKITVKQSKFWALKDANFDDRKDKAHFDLSDGVWFYVRKTTKAGPDEEEVQSNRLEFHSKHSGFIKFSTVFNRQNAYVGGRQSVLVLSPDENDKPFFDTSWIVQQDYRETDVEYELFYPKGDGEEGQGKQLTLSEAFTKFQEFELGDSTVYDYIELLNQFPYNDFHKKSDGSFDKHKLNYNSLVGLRVCAVEYINNIEKAELAERNKDKNPKEEYNLPLHDKFYTEDRKNFFNREVLAGLAKFLYTKQFPSMRAQMRTWLGDEYGPRYYDEYMSRVLHPAARAAADKWIDEGKLDEIAIGSLDLIGSYLNDFVQEVINNYLKMKDSQVWNTIFRNFEDGMTLDDLIGVQKIYRQRALNTRHHLETQRSNRYIFRLFESNDEDNEKNQKNIGKLGKRIKEEFKEIFPQVVEAYKEIPITLNLEEAKKVIEETTLADAKDGWRMHHYKTVKDSAFESKFSGEINIDAMVKAIDGEKVVEDYLVTYFLNFVMLDYEEIMLRYLSRSPDLKDLKMTDFNNTENMNLLRLLLYSFGSLDFNKSLDTKYIKYEEIDAFAKNRLLLI